MTSRKQPPFADLFLIEESREDRLNRLERIRRMVAAGDYEVPAEDVADAVYAFFSRVIAPPRNANPGPSDDTC